MKRLHFLLYLTLSIFIFTSCGDDSEDEAPNAVLGTWTSTDIQYAGTTTPLMDGGELFKVDFIGESVDVSNYRLILNSDQSYTVEGDFVINLTTTFFGETQTQEVTGERLLSNGNWTQNGNVLIFTFNP